VAVSKIKVIDVKNWVSRFTLENGQPASPQTVHKAYTVLCMILDTAVEVDAVRVNSARQIQTHSKESVLPKNKLKKLPKILEIPDLFTLAENSCEYRPMILLMGILGPRVGETAGLKVKDFDLAKGIFTISRSLSPVKGSLIEGPPKNNKPRTLHIPQILFPEIQPLIEGRDPEEYVFLSPMGHPLNSQNFNKRVWKKVFEGTGIQKVRVHDLRHTAASIFISNGANPVVVCELLGHSDPAFTLRVYSHLFNDDLKKVSNSVGELVSRSIIKENSKIAKSA
jgi:integrase